MTLGHFRRPFGLLLFRFYLVKWPSAVVCMEKEENSLRESVLSTTWVSGTILRSLGWLVISVFTH